MAGLVKMLLKADQQLIVPRFGKPLIKPIKGTGLWYLFLLAEFYLLSIPYKKIVNSTTTRLSAIELSLLFAVSCLLTCIPTIRYFEISRIMEYAFFFVLGNRMTKMEADTKLSICLFIFGFALSVVSIVIGYHNLFLERIISVFISVGLVLTFRHIKYGGRLGKFMIEIYILHLFIVPAFRVVLTNLLPHNLLINILFCSLLGLLLPIMFGAFTRKVRINSLIFSPVSCYFKRRNQI